MANVLRGQGIFNQLIYVDNAGDSFPVCPVPECGVVITDSTGSAFTSSRSVQIIIVCADCTGQLDKVTLTEVVQDTLEFVKGA